MLPLAVHEEDDFLDLVWNMSRLQHQNITSLLGYCVDQGQYSLVYEYASGRSLADALFSSNDTCKALSWKARVKISLGVAHAIEYVKLYNFMLNLLVLLVLCLFYFHAPFMIFLLAKNKKECVGIANIAYTRAIFSPLRYFPSYHEFLLVLPIYKFNIFFRYYFFAFFCPPSCLCFCIVHQFMHSSCYYAINVFSFRFYFFIFLFLVGDQCLHHDQVFALSMHSSNCTWEYQGKQHFAWQPVCSPTH